MARKKEYESAERQGKKGANSSPLRGREPQSVPGSPTNKKKPATKKVDMPSGGSGGNSLNDQ